MKYILIIFAFLFVASTPMWVPIVTDNTMTGIGITDDPLKVDTSIMATRYAVNTGGAVLQSTRRPVPIVVSWDGNGGVVGTGNTIYRQVGYSGTILSWSVVATGTSPTTTIDIWKVGTGTSLPTVANTIMGTKPALASGNATRSTTKTSWTTLTVTEGDIIAFNLDAVSNATAIWFTIEFE